MYDIRHQFAAEEIYDNLDRINGEAGQAGQVEQDADADRACWVRLVATIIAANEGVRQPQCWYDEWRPAAAK